MSQPNSYRTGPDPKGHFGAYGGRFVAETLMPNVMALEKAYEEARLPVTSKIVLQNRTAPPNVIVDTVEQRTGGKKFEKLEDIISQDEMKAIFERYQKVAGSHVQQVSRS